MTTYLHTRATAMNKTRIWYQNLRVLDGCRILSHISIRSHNLFVSHIALPVKSDIKKPCQQHIQARCPWKYESNHRKCLLLLIGRFRIGHMTFRRFPQMYFWFPRHHVDISGWWQNFIMAINSPRSPWLCLKAHGHNTYSFEDTEAKVDWGEFYPPPSCRDKG